MNTPEHYTPVMPYFLVPDAKAFIEFVKTVFDSKEILTVPDEDGRIMHAEYSINGGTIMLGQSNGEWKSHPNGTFVVTDDVDGTHARGLAAGATVLQEPGDQCYGRASGFLDAWNNQWWLNTPAEE